MDQTEEQLLNQGQLLAVSQWLKIAALFISAHGALGLVVHSAGGVGQLGSLPGLIAALIAGGGLYVISRSLDDYSDSVRIATGVVAVVGCLLVGVGYIQSQSIAPLSAAPSLGGWVGLALFGGLGAFGLYRNRASEDKPRLGLIGFSLFALTSLVPVIAEMGFLHYLVQIAFVASIAYLLIRDEGAFALALSILFVLADVARGRDDFLLLAAGVYLCVLADLFLASASVRRFFESVVQQGKPNTWESDLPTFQTAVFVFPTLFLAAEVMVLLSWATGCPGSA